MQSALRAYVSTRYGRSHEPDRGGEGGKVQDQGCGLFTPILTMRCGFRVARLYVWAFPPLSRGDAQAGRGLFTPMVWTFHPSRFMGSFKINELAILSRGLFAPHN